MKRNLTIGIFLLIAFALWTVLIMFVDVQAVGANSSKVGFATFNAWFHQLTISTFAKKHNAKLTVMENGEHWFHTEEQMQFLDNWIRR